MQLLHLITGDDTPSPKFIYYTLRILLLVASIVFGKSVLSIHVLQCSLV